MISTIKNFWNEISKVLNENYNESELISIIQKALLKYSMNNIHIEVSRMNNRIEIIFCWWHKKDTILLIKQILGLKPKIDNYKFIWPKPANWFDFEININWGKTEANNLLFYPLKSKKNINAFWISVCLRNKNNISSEILWKIIETWIWDELASEIDYLEIEDKFDNDYMPIDKLWDYIIWLKTRAK